MGKIRKAIASISLVAVLSTLVLTTTAFAYSDVPADHWGYSYVEALKTAGAIDDAEKFRPNDNIVRAEVAKIVAKYLMLEGDTLGSSMFSDSVAGTWYDSYIGIMAQYGIMTGDQGKDTVRPGADVNRAEVAKMLVEANGLESAGVMGSDVFPDVSAGAWYDEYMGTAYCYGIVGGYQDGTAGPAKNASRVEFAKMAVKASEGVMIDACVDGGGTPGPGPSGGDVSVSDANSPDTMTIASNATSVEILDFKVSAGDGGTTVNAVTIKKSGVSTLASGFQAYLYEGTDRLTNGKAVNSESDEIYFTNLGWTVEAGKSRTFTLKVDIGDVTTSGEVKFAVSDIDAGDSSVTGLPVSSATHGLSTTDVGTITIDKDSSITNPKVGEQDVIVARFKASAATEDAMVEQFGVYFTGNIDTEAIQNLELYVAGDADPVATTVGLNSKDVASFIFDTPFTIVKGDTKSFTVKADLNTGRSADTLKAYVDENTDVVAVGAKYGYGMQVTRTNYDGDSCTSSSGDCSYSALEGGDITISSNGPAATDVATNAKDVVLMNFNITSVSPVTFKNFEVALTAAESADTDEGLLNDSDSDSANLTDIKIVNTATGKTLMGPVDATSFVTATGGSTAIAEATDGAQAFYKYTDEFDMAAGESLNLALTADVKNDTDLEGMTVIPALSLTSSLPEVRDINNKVVTNTSSIVPSSTITGKTMTVKSPTLTVALSSDPTDNKTYVKGSKAVKFACFSLNASQSSDIKITSLTLGSSFDENNDDTWGTAGTDNSVSLNAVVGSVALVDGAGVVKVPAKAVASTGTVTFDNMNYTVTAGATQLLCVQGDVSADAYKNSTNDEVAFGITAVGSIVAEDKNGNTLAAGQKVGPALNSGTTDATLVDAQISGGGTLTIAVDPATAKEDVVVAGTTGVALSKFKFTTTDEGFTVKKLSINNRYGSAVADYDNNVSKVTISYKDKAGTTKTADGYLANGTANFSGLDFYIGKDTDDVLTVTADLNTIAGGSAAAGEFVDLNIALNDFEAIAEGSGETYKASKMADSDADGTILDEELIVSGFDDSSFVGTVAYGIDAADVIGGTTLGSSYSLSIDDDAGADVADLPVGTLLCMMDGADAACASATMDIYVVTAWTDGSTEDTVTVTLVSDGGDGTYDATDNVRYAVPGNQYLTGAHQMHVYEAKASVAANASTPTGTSLRSPVANDVPFIFDVAELGGKEKLQLRAGMAGDDENDPVEGAGIDDADVAVTSAAQEVVDGAGSIEWTFDANSIADGDCFLLDEAYTAGVPDDYKYVSFWINTSETDVTYDTVELQLDTNNACAAGTASYNLGESTTYKTFVNGTALSDGTGAINGGTADVWALVTVDISNIVTSSHTYLGFGVDATAGTTDWAATDELRIDGVVFHNEMVKVDITSDGDFNIDETSGQTAYLKEGGTVVATAGVGFRSTSQASILFVPSGLNPSTTEPDIEVSKGTSKAFSVQLDSGTLLDEDAGVDDPVTFTLNLGSASDGTVTAGGVWWRETNAIVQWLGNVSSSTVTGNVKY